MLEEELKEIDLPPYEAKNIIKFGLLLLLIVFIGIGGWMATAPLATYIVTGGQVKLDSKKKIVQHLEGGIVKKIYVKEGDNVKKGQLLLELDDLQIKSRLEQLQKQIESLNVQINTNQTRLKSIIDEKQEWEKLFEKRLVDKQKIRDLQREENRLKGEIRRAQTEIQRVKEQIIAENDKLKRTKILSPSDGIVFNMDVTTVGGVVTPGKPIMEIVPEDTKMIVEAKAQIQDIDKLKVGLPANIRFSAFDMKHTDEVEGKVVYVSPDTFIDKANGRPYYKVKIEVTKKGKQQLKKYHFNLVAGMPAEVMIRIGERTMLSYLIKPMLDMVSRGFNEE